MFQPIPTHPNIKGLDADIISYWEDNCVFPLLVNAKSKDGPLFSFYEGPPTANGQPGIHHVLTRAYKDVICRYRTMRGFNVPRKAGWDTHGLPVEIEVEKALNLNSKADIEQFGIEKFNAQCRESVDKYILDWQEMTQRIGYWVDFDSAYTTMSTGYIETAWWIIKELYNRELLQTKLTAVPHCPRCVTTLSSHEVAQAYQTITEQSVFVRFRANALIDNMRVYFLVWTSTPWTLPGNTALALAADTQYSLIQTWDHNDKPECLILATDLVDKLIGENYTTLNIFSSEELKDWTYVPVIPCSKYKSRIVISDFVDPSEGTGIVHIAPAFGGDDLEIYYNNPDITLLNHVDQNGVLTYSEYEYPDANQIGKGLFFSDANKDIISHLRNIGALFKQSRYRHSYPFCWRCHSPLIYYVKESWFIMTSRFKDRMLELNQTINWYPSHIKDGRFGEWLQNNQDWSLSRERYWGTPLPIWICDACKRVDVIESLDELSERAGDDLSTLNPHRPYIDQVKWQCKSDQSCGIMQRIPEVADAWFDSGIMPYAQWEYPKHNQDIATDGRFPAEFICEALDQTRGWFYSLHALSTLLFDDVAYRNVICLGLLLDDKGQKMSKRLNNRIETGDVLDKYGADALRWQLFIGSTPGEPRKFSERDIQKTYRRVILTLWNSCSFFTSYANLDDFNPNFINFHWIPTYNVMDRWMLTETNKMIEDVSYLLDNYNPQSAAKRIEEHLDNISNWYIRCNRRRFWKTDSDSDKLSAYRTLYWCLINTLKAMAPFTPFVSEFLYRNLMGNSEISVHLTDFPEVNPDLVFDAESDSLELARNVIQLGRSARSKAGIKVRQPLNKMVCHTKGFVDSEKLELVTDLIKDELNLKEFVVGNIDLTKSADVVISSEDDNMIVGLDTTITTDLKIEGVARDLIRSIQELRKGNGNTVDQYVNLNYYSKDNFVHGAIVKFGDHIKQETLTNNISFKPTLEELVRPLEIDHYTVYLQIAQ